MEEHLMPDAVAAVVQAVARTGVVCGQKKLKIDELETALTEGLRGIEGYTYGILFAMIGEQAFETVLSGPHAALYHFRIDRGNGKVMRLPM